jgi:hypothetical protein
MLNAGIFMGLIYLVVIGLFIYEKAHDNLLDSNDFMNDPIETYQKMAMNMLSKTILPVTIFYTILFIISFLVVITVCPTVSLILMLLFIFYLYFFPILMGGNFSIKKCTDIYNKINELVQFETMNPNNCDNESLIGMIIRWTKQTINFIQKNILFILLIMTLIHIIYDCMTNVKNGSLRTNLLVISSVFASILVFGKIVTILFKIVKSNTEDMPDMSQGVNAAIDEIFPQNKNTGTESS